MSTYPGEDPQSPRGQQPADGPSESPTEPIQPAGYWERQAAEQGQAPYGQAPYGQVPYDQAPGANPYGQPVGQPGWYPPQAGQPPYPPPPGTPSYGGGWSQPQRDHPQATLSMVLGLVGLVGALVLCGLPLVVSPFAWAIGRGAVKEIEASQGRLGGEGQARAGMIMGIVGTVFLILAILAVIGFIVLVIAADSTGTGTGSSV